MEYLRSAVYGNVLRFKEMYSRGVDKICIVMHRSV